MAAGEEPDNAVNFAQLQEIKNQIAANSLVKQDGGKAGRITIGIETGGSEINIANKSGDARAISGVKEAVKDDEAVNKKQLDGEIADITDSIKVIKEANSFAVLYDKDADGTINYKCDNGGTEINVANKSGDARTISDVKAAERNDESVNKAQLDKSIEKISNDINLTSAAAVLYDKENGTVNYGSVTLGGMDNQAHVALHNVKDGIIAQVSHDAINGNQINEISGDIANYFCGGAGYNNGEWTAPTFKITQFKADGSSAEKKDYHNVASAFDGVSESMSKINDRIQNVENTVSSNGLNWNEQKKAYDASLDSQPSKIINVEDGKIAEGSKEAVNGGQLHDYTEQQMKVVLDQSKHYTDQRVNNIVIDAIDDAVDRAHQYTDMKFNILSYDIRAYAKNQDKQRLLVWQYRI